MSILSAVYKDKLIGINEYTTDMKGSIVCKCCDSELRAKKGNINVHHFGHVSKLKCDDWYYKDNKGSWHIMWQNICNMLYLEYIMIKNDVKHIADIFNVEKNMVIEIQNSNIDKQHIENREKFYENMIWIINLKNLLREDGDFNSSDSFILLETILLCLKQIKVFLNL